MIDSHIRYYIQFIFDKGALVFIKLKISPNMITILSFIAGIAGSAMIFFQFTWLAFILVALSGILDIFDGTVARLTNASTSKGAFLDLVLDRMVETAIVFSFALIYPQFYIIYMLFYISVIFNFTTFMLAGMLIANNGEKSMHYDFGLIERTETFIAFLAMILFATINHILLLILTILIFLTGIIRFIKILYLSQDETNE